MTRFQIFLLVFFGLILIGSVAMLIRARSPKLSLLTALVSLAAGLATIWPDATTRLAKLVGIQRGTDLILYCAVLAMMVGFFLFYIRLRILRRELTEVVRHLAIQEAVEHGPAASTDRHDDHVTTERGGAT